MTERLIDSFLARTISGKEYRVLVFQEQIAITTMDNRTETVPGARRFATGEGLDVNYISPSLYQIVTTAETLRKI